MDWTLRLIRMILKCDPLDCTRQGSDNGAGDLPFIAPMKTKFLKRLVVKNKQRGAVALLSFVCLILFVLTTGTAQLRNQKHVIALQLGEAAEGSRVTVVGDSALNDYEAFRRGDRFYVKIPLADFTASFPQLRADGFEDVQVQKVGDSVVVSFKLQPGASARVDQRSNRLDVIFSAPNRSTRNSVNATTNRATPGTNVSRTAQDRGPDAAGPRPGGSELAYRPRVVTPRAADAYEGRTRQNPRAQNSSRSDSRKNENSSSRVTRGNSAVNAPSPVPSPSSILSPTKSTSYPPLTTSSPATSSSPNPALNSSASASSSNWRTRANTVGRWMAANRLATLLGALILLSLILYLVLGLRGRGKDGTKAKRLKTLKAQPKVQPTHFPDAEAPGVAGAASVAAPAPRPSSVLTKPLIGSPTTDHDEHREEEEREVFEL